MRITKETILVTGIALTSFVLGGWFMYLVDTTWVYDKVEGSKEKSNDKMARYIEALDVSHQMLDNSYDAFYLVSECSTKAGCDFVSTADSLTELNIERKILRRKLDQLLDGTEASWSKNAPL